MNHYFTNNENLKSDIKLLTTNINGREFKFYSDNGVFSKEKIDYGSRFLIETFLSVHGEPNKKVLDVGCGYGIIGIVISKLNDSFCHLIDINKRSVHLSNRNIELNDAKAEAFLSNIYDSVKDKYDFVITNPPIRAGKEVVTNILMNAPLNENGELWCVIRKNHGAKSYIKILEEKYIVKIIDKSNGFYIINAKKGVDI